MPPLKLRLVQRKSVACRFDDAITYSLNAWT